MIRLNDNYSTEIRMPNGSKILQYSIIAEDDNNNIAKIDKNINVIDVIPPEIFYLSPDSPTTGDEFILMAEAQDNILVETFHLEYWFDFGYHFELLFNESLNITTPDESKKFNYIFTAIDTSGNLNNLENSVNVIDNDHPIIDDKIPDVTTGDEVTFNFKSIDNIGVTYASVDYWFDDDEHGKAVFMTAHRVYLHTIIAPHSSKELSYTILTKDSYENIAKVTRVIQVIDNDEPLVLDHSTKSGSSYRFSAKVMDNLEVSSVKVNYWSEDGIIKTKDLQLIDGLYEGQISLPKDTNKVCYVISANDTSDNWGLSKENEIEISIQEQISPLSTFKNVNSWFILLIILLIIIGAGLVFYSTSKRKAEDQGQDSKLAEVEISKYKTLPTASTSANQNLSVTPTREYSQALSSVASTDDSNIGQSLQPTIQPSPKLTNMVQPSLTTGVQNQQNLEPQQQIVPIPTPQLPPAKTKITQPITEKPSITTQETPQSKTNLNENTESGVG
jgi:hypothetical protein